MCAVIGHLQLMTSLGIESDLERFVYNKLHACVCVRVCMHMFNCTYWSRSYRVIYKVYHISNELYLCNSGADISYDYAFVSDIFKLTKQQYYLSVYICKMTND